MTKKVNITFGVLIALIILFSITSFGSENNKDEKGNKTISEEFRQDCLKTLTILEIVISNKSLYTDDERRIIREFSETKYTPYEEEFKYPVLKTSRKYFSKINHKNLDDPKNDLLVNELLGELDNYRKELQKM
ncbi:hypothetical protein [Paenibacillus abyssi]|uniref:Uncharacterized protein n=1 Tax=Paenibacillus abyssi TaxID=1340531 RepID=A0A917LER4_9BACL|nr:hypothetical protein [Paenibacillus abyssi]GGG17348.1 hypothetical protein GCM10010916_37720 [Paenibacillus abyssi]